jgi:hypothetical protein
VTGTATDTWRRTFGTWTAASVVRVNVLVTLLGLLLFGAVNATSGRLAANDGLGWDGRQYAHMVTGRLVDGNVPTQTRPLLPLLTRVPYRLGLDVISAFQVMNVLSAFALYFLTCLMLDRYGVGAAEKCFFIACLALSIATGRMFGFYPVQIDLGVLAVLMAATYLVVARGGWLAGAAVIVAVTAREFAAALAFLFVVRALRQRRDIVPAVVSGAIAVAVLFAIRWWAAATNVGDPIAPLQTRDTMLENLELWRDPAFVAFFVYFTVTLVGGVTCLLAGRALWCLLTLLRRPELGVYAALIVAAAAAGNADIWRYLVFLLPVVTILFGKFAREFRPAPALLVGALVLTIVTQEPFARMTLDTYFQDWFPFYRVRDSDIDLTAFWAVWSRRFLLTIAGFVTLTVAQWLWRTRRLGRAGPAPGLAG